MPNLSSDSTPDSQHVEIEVLSEDDYQHSLEWQNYRTQQDQQARARARKILQSCENGFTPNLIEDSRLSAFDTLTASRMIIKLLQLSLAEDQRCALGESRLTYLRGEGFAIAKQCGHMLYQLGGTRLMNRVMEGSIPAFDQDNLKQAWQGIGDRSATALKAGQADQLPYHDLRTTEPDI